MSGKLVTDHIFLHITIGKIYAQSSPISRRDRRSLHRVGGLRERSETRHRLLPGELFRLHAVGVRA